MKLLKKIINRILKWLKVPTMNDFVANYEEYSKKLHELGEKTK